MYLARRGCILFWREKDLKLVESLWNKDRRLRMALRSSEIEVRDDDFAECDPNCNPLKSMHIKLKAKRPHPFQVAKLTHWFCHTAIRVLTQDHVN